MLGQNKVTSPFREAHGAFKIAEGPFYTLQGEGPDAGRPAIFIRLAHCNLRCYFCDTEFERARLIPADTLCSIVARLASERGCDLIVITGGEPLLQDICDFTYWANNRGLSVSIETAGLVHYEGLDDLFSPTRNIFNNLIVCSPKTPKINESLERIVGAYKYIIKAGHTGVGGFPNMSTQIEGERMNVFVPRDHTVPIYLQPMDEGDAHANADNLAHATELCLRHGRRLSIQMHKIAGVP